MSRQSSSVRYSFIPDNDTTLEQVTTALREAGLESSDLIIGIDFTKSNEWTGKVSFNGQSLHAIGDTRNPYEEAISIIGKTLAPFADNNLVPCFGFGDATTHDSQVFSFHNDQSPCHGFEEVLACYKYIVPNLRLAGPTSYAPVIDAAIDMVEKRGGQYHVLVIIADGQVTRTVNTSNGDLSPQEKTIQSIVNASSHPLSIVLVEVGDGPWGDIQRFVDKIPAREFNNFQFVNFTSIMSENKSPAEKETAFAFAALKGIPVQYRAAFELGLLGRVTGKARKIEPRPPPVPYTRRIMQREPSNLPSPSLVDRTQALENRCTTGKAGKAPHPPPVPYTNGYPTMSGKSKTTTPSTTTSSSFHQRCPAMSGQSSSVSSSFKDKMIKYSLIPDHYTTRDQVTAALREAGLESSQLILGIDFTKSNEWTGKVSFNNRSLHAIGNTPNPYEEGISIIGKTLAPFNDGNSILCFGFGDATTHDNEVFSFHNDHTPCHGCEEVLTCYRNIVPNLRCAGPTSYAPVIDAAIDIVFKSNGRYHVLFIISDGQVNGGSRTQDENTMKSIVRASSHPLSIVLVGVGDGPWGDMQRFVDKIPAREFNNFQFVNFTAIMSENKTAAKKERAFALAALKQILIQYEAVLKFDLLGYQCCSRWTIMSRQSSSISSSFKDKKRCRSECATTSRQSSSVSSSFEDKKSKYSFIPDNYTTLEQVMAALREAGLESSELILGIDFRKSNGKVSFNNRSLHAIGNVPNPYEKAISIIGKTLAPFDDDNLIPCFGFGDDDRKDGKMFSFHDDHSPCHGFEEVLARYKDIVQHLRLGEGQTSFAPVIDAAINMVEISGGRYHILLIIADGQLNGVLSPQDDETIKSIVNASNHPLSIVLVGVGDAPWKGMQRFADKITGRKFDNVQFVNFTAILSKNKTAAERKTAFALAVLMKIPIQYKAASELGLLGHTTRRILLLPRRILPLPPPSKLPSSSACPICLTRAKDLAFACGHRTCRECGHRVSNCPICRVEIKTLIRLYN